MHHCSLRSVVTRSLLATATSRLRGLVVLLAMQLSTLTKVERKFQTASQSSVRSNGPAPTASTTRAHSCRYTLAMVSSTSKAQPSTQWTRLLSRVTRKNTKAWMSQLSSLRKRPLSKWKKVERASKKRQRRMMNERERERVYDEN